MPGRAVAPVQLVHRAREKVMACQQACLDCPFRRDATPDINYDFDFIEKHFSDDPEEYICEEQGDICFGQIQMHSNSNMTIMLDPFSDFYDLVENTKIDREFYFWFPNEMRWYHETGGQLYGQEWYWNRSGRSNKKAEAKAVVSGTQLTFDDYFNR